MDKIIITTYAAMSLICWIIVAAGAATAVFSKAINDTLLERIGLGCICVVCIGSASRVITIGWVTEGSLSVSAGFAVYVLAVFWKYWRAAHGGKS